MSSFSPERQHRDRQLRPSGDQERIPKEKNGICKSSLKSPTPLGGELLLQGNDLVQVTIHSYDHHLEVVFEQACFSAVREGRQEHEQDSACDFEW